jgi:MFS family permease
MVVLGRGLDDTFSLEVRQRITLLTLARTTANGCFRFAPPFLATIASGLDVSLDTIGIAVAVSELSGLLSPATGAFAERFHRRTAMASGLIAVGLGALIAAGAQNLVMLAVALVVMNQSKVLFDLGLGAWVSDRVPYEQRGRVIGLTETSWALGLLLGVTSMGLIASVTSWRLAYVFGAVAVIVLGSLVATRVPDDPVGHQQARRSRERRCRASWRWWPPESSASWPPAKCCSSRSDRGSSTTSASPPARSPSSRSASDSASCSRR